MKKANVFLMSPLLAIGLLLAPTFTFAQANPCAAKNPCAANPCATKGK